MNERQKERAPALAEFTCLTEETAGAPGHQQVSGREGSQSCPKAQGWQGLCPSLFFLLLAGDLFRDLGVPSYLVPACRVLLSPTAALDSGCRAQ